MTKTHHRPTAIEPSFEFVAGPGIPAAAEAYAREKMARLHRLAPGRIGRAQVTVTLVSGRSPCRGYRAQADLDLGTRRLYADVEASEAFEAIDLLQHRLRAEIARTTGRTRIRVARRRIRAGACGGVGRPDGAAADRVRTRLELELDRLRATRAVLLTEGLDAMSECEDLSELSGADQHPADLGTETFDRSRDLSMLHEIEAEIDEVRDAFARLHAGTYGRCEVCGDVIPDDRLAARPAARRCLADQERAERAAAGRAVGMRR